MARVEVQTTKEIRPDQLAVEVGTDIFTSEGIVQAEGVTQQQLEDAVAAHTSDPDWGKPAEDKNLEAIRAKAQAVFDGSDTFTAAQLQKIAAAIVLRATR